MIFQLKLKELYIIPLYILCHYERKSSSGSSNVLKTPLNIDWAMPKCSIISASFAWNQRYFTKGSSTYCVIFFGVILNPTFQMSSFVFFWQSPPPTQDYVIFLNNQKITSMNFPAPKGSIILTFFLLSYDWNCSIGFLEESFVVGVEPVLF